MDYEGFKRSFFRLKGLDLDAYKDGRMKRRISTLMEKHGIGGYADYLQIIENDPSHFDRLLDYITINTTHFFRNPDNFAYLSEEILPRLFQSKNRLKCWSAACANGAEPYSLAILFLEYFPGRCFEILATDIDPNILEDARSGAYSEDKLREVDPSFKQKYFQKEEGTFRIQPRVQENISFRVHDLFKEEYPTGQDLILCRNFFIYLKPDTKRKLVHKFYRALNQGGIFFTGNAEYVFNISELGFEKVAPSFFRRR